LNRRGRRGGNPPPYRNGPTAIIVVSVPIDNKSKIDVTLDKYIERMYIQKSV